MAPSTPDEDTIRTDSRRLDEDLAAAAAAGRRPLGVTLVVAGVVHLLAPRALLRMARLGYRVVLNVRFRPQERAPRRVRLVGTAMLAVGARLLSGGGRRRRS